MRFWTKERVEKLYDMLVDPDNTYEMIAKEFGVARGAVAGAIHRYIRLSPITSPRKRTKPRSKPEAINGPTARTVSRPGAIHQNLIEPWAEYTLRKQKERAEAKAAALKLLSRHAEPTEVTGSEGTGG